MLKGFIMPEKARITKVIINGVERKIEPPIEIEAGDVISFPYESAQQSVQRTASGECTCLRNERTRGIIQFLDDCPVHGGR